MMKFTELINKAADIAAELILTNKCIVCHDVIEFGTDKWLCPECSRKLKQIDGLTCDICGVPIISGNICADCRERKNYFKKAYCAYLYEGDIRNIIHDIKFRGYKHYMDFFVERLTEFAKLSGFECADTVTPVPLHKSKLKKEAITRAPYSQKVLQSPAWVFMTSCLKR